MNKKMILLVTVCLLGTLLIAGCTRNSNTPTPTPMSTPRTSPMSSVAPIASPSPSIVPSASPSNSPMTSSAPTTGADTSDLDAAKKIEGAVDKLSEVKKSVALVNGNRALIAVEFDSAYKGAMTDRIEQMIADAAKEADSKVTEVSVTDDPNMLDDVRDMRSKVDGGNLMEDIKAEFDKLVQRIKPMA